MIAFRPKIWAGLGAVALLGGGVAACGDNPFQKTETAATAAASDVTAQNAAAATTPLASGEGAGGEAGADTAYGAIPAHSAVMLRYQHLKGFVLAAQAAHKAGKSDDASLLIQQGVLEALRPQAAALGATPQGAKVQPALDQAVAALDGKTADAPARIQAALNAIDQASVEAGGDALAVMLAMVSITDGLYQGVLVDGVVDPTEYQHSMGAALATLDMLQRARPILQKADGARYLQARSYIEEMVGFWPTVTPPKDLIAPSRVAAQASRIELTLSGITSPGPAPSQLPAAAPEADGKAAPPAQPR
jgi:hypothetical protein